MSGGLSALDLFALGAYLVGITALGLWMAKRAKSLRDYFLGGRRFGKLFMVMYAFGTGTHTDHAVAVAGAAVKLGMAGIWYQWLWLFCTPFYWLIAPWFRRTRYITIGDFYEGRYSRSLAVVYALWGILVTAVQMGLMLKGTGKVIEAATGGAISVGWAVALTTLLFVIYGVAGGIPAAVVTDLIQGSMIILLSFLIIPFMLHEAGGFVGLHQRLPEEMFRLTAPKHPPPPYDPITPFYIAMITLNALVGIVAQPHTLAVTSVGRTEMEGRVGFCYGNMVKRLCTIGWTLTGLGALVLFPQLVKGDPERAFGVMAQKLLPTGLVGVMIASMIAAVMSTCDSLMVVASALFTRNVYQRCLRPEAPEGELLLVGRVTAALTVAGGLLVAFLFATVIDILKLFWKLAAIMGVPIWVGLAWRRANPAGAWAAIVGGFLAWLVSAKVFGLPFLWQIVSYLSASFGLIFAVGALTKPLPKEKLEKFYALIHTPVGREEELRRRGVEVVME